MTYDNLDEFDCHNSDDDHNSNSDDLNNDYDDAGDPGLV